MLASGLSKEQKTTLFEASSQEPYMNIVKKLSQIDDIESPMNKLEHIYNCCTDKI